MYAVSPGLHSLARPEDGEHEPDLVHGAGAGPGEVLLQGRDEGVVLTNEKQVLACVDQSDAVIISVEQSVASIKKD